MLFFDVQFCCIERLYGAYKMRSPKMDKRGQIILDIYSLFVSFSLFIVVIAPGSKPIHQSSSFSTYLFLSLSLSPLNVRLFAPWRIKFHNIQQSRQNPPQHSFIAKEKPPFDLHQVFLSLYT